MAGSNRGFYIVATLVAIIVLGVFGAAETRCQREQDAYQAHYSGQPGRHEISQFRSQRGWIPCLVEREVANPETANTTEHDQRDLVAQEAAALWGFWIALFAGLQMAATIVGLAFIKRTLDATWGAVEKAGEAVQATKESAAETRRIGEAQVRAYLNVIGLTMLITNEGLLQLCVEMKNSGQSPAIDLQLFYLIEVRQISSETQQDIAGRVAGNKGTFNIPAAAPFKFPNQTCEQGLDDGMIEALKEPDVFVAFAVYIYFKWKDVFGNQHEETEKFSCVRKDYPRDVAMEMPSAQTMASLVLSEVYKRKHRGEWKND